jgi:hypothetical protein
VRDSRVQPALAAAQAAGAKLSAAVREEVVLQKEALLAEVDAVTALEREVATVDAGVQSLAAASAALAGAPAAPHAPMTRAVAALQNIHDASALLRAVARFRFCTAKLAAAALFPAFSAAQKTAPEHLPAAAHAVRELEDGLLAPPLDSVDQVAKCVPAVRKAAVELRRRTAAMLKAGLAARDQPAVTAAVVAFHALGILADRVNAEVGRLLAETQTAMQRGLEPPRAPSSFPSLKPPAAVAAAAGSAAAAAAAAGATDAATGATAAHAPWEVWSRVEAMLDTVRDSCFKAILLQQVLSKQYDDATHVSLLHEPIASGFIDAVGKALGEQLAVLARTHRQRATTGQVFRALAADYPRLRAALAALAGRVYAHVRASPHPITAFERERAGGHMPIVPDRIFVEGAFVPAAADVERHYLSASLERLTSAVTAVFAPGRPPPAEAEALSIARLLAAELAASRPDSDLFSTSVSNVATALRMYSRSAEDYAAGQAPGDGGAGGPVIVRDWPLARLYNGLVTLTAAARRVLGSDDSGAGPPPPAVQAEVAAMAALADRLLEGPFATCTARVARAIEHIHTEDLTCHPGSDDGCSIYAVDVTAQLSMFADGVVLVLARSRTLGQFTLTLAHRVLDLFVQHATLAFPLPERARLRLATDMARIELAAESLCPVRLLGGSYLALRALRRIVFMTEDELAGRDALDTLACLAPSAVAHHLFSRAKDASFLHPHRRQDVAPGAYSTWLDAHSEDEAWAAVEEAVALYEATAPSSPCAQYKALTAVAPALRDRWAALRAADKW